MIARIWTTAVKPERAAQYEAFAREVSLPMFRQQAGFRGALMARRAGECLVITVWEDEQAVAALAGSESYRQTVARIMDQGFLCGEQTVSLYDVHLVECLGSALGEAGA